jgi:hypothetical protein
MWERFGRVGTFADVFDDYFYPPLWGDGERP